MPIFFVLLSLMIASLALPSAPALAADCGGSVACACGDTVLRGTVLEADLEDCTQTGLVVGPGVTLDCRGHAVRGRSSRDGILLAEAEGARVRGCTVTGFRTGIRVRGSHGQLVSENLLTGNRRGFSVGDGASNVRFEHNRVETSAEIGVYIGPDTSDVSVVRNVILDGLKENVEVVGSASVAIDDNILGGVTRYALRLTDSPNGRVRGNEIRSGKIQVRGASSGSLFLDDLLLGREGYEFRGEEDREGNWSFPDHGVIRGGAIPNASRCFRFAGSSYNEIDGVALGVCVTRPVELKTLNGQAAVGNTIDGSAVAGNSSGGVAGFCGGSKACVCGDTLTASSVLSGDLVGCTRSGLRLASGVTLDCGGFAILGRSTSDGVLIDNADGARVRNCRIEGFGAGIRIRGGARQRLTDLLLRDNDVGIRIEQGATGSQVERAVIEQSRDTGVRVEGASEFALSGSLISGAEKQSIELIGVDRAMLFDNVLDQEPRTALRLTNTSRIEVRGNEIRSAGVELRGASSNNVFADNLLLDFGFDLAGLEDRAGDWTFPDRNVFRGGSIPNARRCFRFAGASDNLVEDVTFGVCASRPVDLVSVDGHSASGNRW